MKFYFYERRNIKNIDLSSGITCAQNRSKEGWSPDQIARLEAMKLASAESQQARNNLQQRVDQNPENTPSTIEDIETEKIKKWMQEVKGISKEDFSTVETIKIQTALFRLGVYKGEINGLWGEKTADGRANQPFINALKTFQQDHGIAGADGYLLTVNPVKKDATLQAIIDELNKISAAEEEPAPAQPVALAPVAQTAGTGTGEPTGTGTREPTGTPVPAPKPAESADTKGGLTPEPAPAQPVAPALAPKPIPALVPPVPAPELAPRPLPTPVELSTNSVLDTYNPDTLRTLLNSPNTGDIAKKQELAKNLGYPSLQEIQGKYGSKDPKEWGEDRGGVIKHFERMDKGVLTLDICSCHQKNLDINNIFKTLDFIEQNKFPAILFISGDALKISGIIPRIQALVDNGNVQFGIHGWEHKAFSVKSGRPKPYDIVDTTQNIPELYWEIVNNAILLQRITGKKPVYSRSPSLYIDDISAQICRELGLPAVGMKGDEYNDVYHPKSNTWTLPIIQPNDGGDVYLGHARDPEIPKLLSKQGHFGVPSTPSS